MKRNICLINHGLSTGGTDSFIMNIISGLDKENFDISLVMALDGQNTRQFHEDDAIIQGAHIFRTCDLNSIKKIIFHFKKLYRLLKKTGPYDAVHSNMDLFNGANLLIARLAGVKIRISHAHTSQSQYEEKTKKHFTVSTYRWIMRKMILNNSTHRLGCSSNAMDYLYGKEWHNDSGSMVVHNGVDLQKYVHDDSVKEQFAQMLRIDSSKKNIITVGHMSEVKNPFFLIDIISELAKLDNTIHFFWIGTGELLPQIINHINDLGVSSIFTLLGVRNDIAEILQCCDCFLLPSIFEGLSISLIEAQAAGLDCFVSDTVTQEANCGKCQFISIRKSAQHWAQTINKHLNSEESFRIDPERLNRFKMDSMLSQLGNIYAGNNG